ncbi:MAG: Carboxylesterase NlhH [Pseudomonadota bacterium]|jgi:acetyl esterase/lipase
MTQATTPSPLDPAIADMERRWKESGIPGLYDGGSGPVSRERANNIRALLYPKPKLPQGAIEPLTLPGQGVQVPARIVRPVQGEPIGTLVYFHGGGWVVGDLDSHEAHAIRLANEAGVVVLNVGYRLAPEHKFPAAIDDAQSAMAWAAAHLAQLGGADKPLAVGGDSAGGNLAAVMGLHCRDQGIALAAQLLMYPATDTTGVGEPAIRDGYFGPDHATLSRDWRASPALAPRLAGMAPVILGVGPYDFLYQDNLRYVARLREEGVPVLLRDYPTLNHGFFSYTAISRDSETAALQLCADLRAQMLARP